MGSVKRVPIPESEDGRDWLSVQDVAAMVGLSEFTVYGAVSRGKLPAVSIPCGKRVFHRILRTDAEAWSQNPYKRTQGGPPPKRTPKVGSGSDALVWTVSQAVAATGLSRQAIHGAIQDGRLKSLDMPHGKRTIRLVKPADVSRVWADRCVG